MLDYNFDNAPKIFSTFEVDIVTNVIAKFPQNIYGKNIFTTYFILYIKVSKLSFINKQNIFYTLPKENLEYFGKHTHNLQICDIPQGEK